MSSPDASLNGKPEWQEPLKSPAFRWYWSGATVGGFGLAVTVIAVEVFVINVLLATEAEVGFIRAVQFLPYLLFGLIGGALVDRWQKKRVIISTNLGRGLLLLMLPVLWVLDSLTLGSIAAVLFLVGAFSVFSAAAEQSILPLLIDRNGLVAANARLGQSITVAQTSGPVLGGGLVGWIGSPLAIVVNAISYLATALLIVPIRVEEPRQPRAALQSLFQEIREGLQYTYRHATLAPMAISTHVWFVAHSASLPVLALFALRQIEMSPFLYGVVLAFAGIGGLIGAVVAPWFGRALGEGNATILGTAISPAAWMLVVVAPNGGVLAIILVAMSQLFYGFGMGMQDPNEMGYRQAITPPNMLGRMNATIRSANRSMAVVGSLAGGVLVALIGYRETMLLILVVFIVALMIIAASPARGARVD